MDVVRPGKCVPVDPAGSFKGSTDEGLSAAEG